MKRYVAFVAAGVLVAGCEGAAPPPSPAPAPAPSVSAATAAPGSATVEHRAAHTMTALGDGSHLVAGGCVVDGCATATDTAYLVGSGAPAPVAGMATPRDAHTATLLTDGRVLVTGGFAGEGQAPLTSAELFDPASGTWQQVGDLAVGRGGHAAALLGDGRVLIAGGWVSSQTYTATTEVFDPTTNEFSGGPDLPEAVDGLAATSLADGSVLVVGGQSTPGVASALAARIDRHGTATLVGSLSHARFKHALVTLPSGEALVLGGTPDDERILRSSEVFDPATATFGPGPVLRGGRYKLSGSAVVLPDGRVAVAGGGPGVEVVDVSAGSSARVADAGSRWASFSTVGVSDGQLLVLGGYDQEIRLTDTDLVVDLADL